ncbi:MAG: hypothetical protein LBS44_01505 [Deltaproteobacteria bacterium]|jgi:16S rRNA (cytosine967-C5)-methyltransferase|nr:hypothetical protein [Deltaproteobacteria bacterium]
MIKYYNEPRRVAYEAIKISAADLKRPEEVLKTMDRLLSLKDQRLAQSLVYESLRHRLRLEYIINSKTPKGRPPKKALLVLTIGLVQLLFLDRIPSFAAVHETVELAKAVIPELSGLVNAVMVKLAGERDLKVKNPENIFPIENCDRNLSSLERLSIFYSYPIWLVKKIVQELGFREARAFLAAGNVHPRPTIRINPLKTTRNEFIKQAPAVPTIFSPYGLTPPLTSASKAAGPASLESGQATPVDAGLWASGTVESWPGFKEGLFSVQDEASQILPLLVGHPQRILDGCAGLGGKTLGLATVFPEATIVAVDTSAKRLQQIPLEAQRLGLAKVPQIIRCDLRQLRQFKENFDLVLVDAPCSSLGVLRRRPDIKWKVSQKDIEEKAALQLELLIKASEFVTSGGRLVYSVCTFTPEEGHEVVFKFLAKKSDFALLEPEKFSPNLQGLFVGPGQVRLWTHRNNTDSFFYGLLEKK